MEKIYYGENENQFGELRLPAGNGPHPVAIVIHGGFWREPFTLESTEKAGAFLNGCGVCHMEHRIQESRSSGRRLAWNPFRCSKSS